MTPSPSPTERLGQLSILESNMAPTTRAAALRNEPAAQSHDSHGEADDTEAEDTIITLPSGLSYSLDHLDKTARLRFSNAGEELTAPTASMFVQKCQARDQEDFAIIELVESVQHVRTVRFGKRNSRFPVPECDCQNEQCCHVLWLFDQVAKEVLHGDSKPLDLMSHGYARELENPYEQISRFHLDMLAEDLYAENWSGGAESDNEDVPNPRRVQEVRRMLALLNEVPADTYRPDLFANPRKRNRVVQKHDLECTIVRMLLDNNDFFRYFASSMKGYDEIMSNLFEPLELRAESVLVAFDAYQRTAPQPPSRHAKDVAWCAFHLRLVDRQVASTVQHTARGLEYWEKSDAARIMLRLLEEVIRRNADVPGPALRPRAERNLYLALVGDVDNQFAMRSLWKLGGDVLYPYVTRMDRILENLGRLGAPASYYQDLEELVRVAKASRTRSVAPSATGSKRRSAESEREAKRAR